ncbi:relaxase/mobilization nuclease domain-containing protein [Leisingera daeponensis]|uniref:Relaxase/mobilization nuclease domain-containing protein n=1 Tax=Leisingera daeponensis TaxID=405746 RepID=A0ABS7NLM7_9RHOB|nr:relaxase/mobilization nuclease domain-containing protein [Leisingera daeponensis]MBY6142099.1 relaxase/mobilization nuclease domain-containing protein [Leisingera daeponensis]
MSDFKDTYGFQDCWPPRKGRLVRNAASGFFVAETERRSNPQQSKASVKANQVTLPARGGQTISAADKARLARVVKGTPEVMVKVTKPAKSDKHGNPIKVTRGTEARRVAEHINYISRNGKLEVETSDVGVLKGRQATAELYRDWIEKHDDARAAGMASDRTRITTSILFSMPGNTNASGVKDAVRALAEQEFGGRHDYAMALHTDTPHPHVHLTVRTVGHDGVKLNLRKADLQHLRDTFAEKLRQRGIEAESTPRHARGKTRRGESTPVYKIRQRGGELYIDAKKRNEVRRDLERNNGVLPTHAWDAAIADHRNRVMRTYTGAARILSQSDDPADRDLAKETGRFTARLTEVVTQRAEIARALEAVPSPGRIGDTTGARGTVQYPEPARGEEDRSRPGRGRER